MKNILKAEFKKLRSSVFMYILLALTVILPFLNSGFLALIDRLVGEADVGGLLGLFNAPYAYAVSFSPTNNVGLLLMITIVVLGANDFSQNTIRNKIIAGYSKQTIFFSTLIYNLIIVGVTMLIYSSATYLFHGLFNGFVAGDFLQIFKYGVIAYSSLIIVYTITTLLTYHFKNIIAPLLITLGSLLGVFALTSILMSIPTQIVDLSFVKHVVPVINLLGPSFDINPSNTSISIVTDLWWVDLLVNMAYIVLFMILGVSIANKTDYK